MKASKEFLSRMCPPGDVPLSAACLGMSGVVAPGFRLRVGSSLAPSRCLRGCRVPLRACVAAVWWGRGWGGARMTRGLRPVGGLMGEAGCMVGVWRRSPGSRTGLAGVPCLAASACRHVRRAIGRHAGVLVFRLARCPARYLRSGGVPGRVGPPLAVALLSAAGAPPLSPWGPPGAPRVAAGRVVRAAWLRRLPVASLFELGHLALVPAFAYLPRGLPVLACRHYTPPRRASLLVSRPPDVGSLSGARGQARSPAGRQPGRWRVSGLGPGPGWGPGTCQMVFPWAVLPVRLVGHGVAGVPARPVPGPADATPGPTCWLSLELGDWGSRWGFGLGGVGCRGVARAGHWLRQSG